MLPRSAIGLAATLTLGTGSVALAAGLYRLDICFNRKGLLAVTGLASVTALVVLLFVNNRPDNSLSGGRDLFTSIVFAAWLATMALIRLLYGIAAKRMALTRRILLLGEPEQRPRIHCPASFSTRIDFRPPRHPGSASVMVVSEGAADLGHRDHVAPQGQ